MQNITIVRKKIKNIYIKVKPTFEIIVTVPYFTPKLYIKYIIKKRQKWIQSKIDFFQNKSLDLKSNNNDIFQYFGKEYKLQIIKNNNEKIILKNKKMILYLNNNENKQKIIDNWYKQKAKKTLSNIIKKYSIITNQDINILRIKKMKTRWGSCNHKKRYINLNQELIKYPLAFVEYVILHEFAHLTHPNHSCDFYDYIYSYMPDFKKRIKMKK
jgi:predicted metal-dependent hydrolase